MKFLLLTIAAVMAASSAAKAETISAEEGMYRVAELMSLQFELEPTQFRAKDSFGDYGFNGNVLVRAYSRYYGSPSQAEVYGAYRNLCGSDDTLGCAARAIAAASK
ncbi:MAG: hypothetical protein EOP11_17770 [Proteobacteria bacterium]|nr:MAG: hypothetical protein EOP11_17770 [Pseudomonadota bacterium]